MHRRATRYLRETMRGASAISLCLCPWSNGSWFSCAGRTQGFVQELVKTSVMQLDGFALAAEPSGRCRPAGGQRNAGHPETLRGAVPPGTGQAERGWWRRSPTSWKSKDAWPQPGNDCPAPPRESTAVVLRSRNNIRTSKLRGAAPSCKRTSRPATLGAARAITWRTSRRGSRRGPSTRPLGSECLAP